MIRSPQTPAATLALTHCAVSFRQVEATAGGLGTRAVELQGGSPVGVAPSDGGAGQAVVHLWFHDKATIKLALVGEILVKDIGLAEDKARKLL
jgi:hypothetical protein